MPGNDLMRQHDQSLMKWTREKLGGYKPCSCGSEVEEWWNYCAMCGRDLVREPLKRINK